MSRKLTFFIFISISFHFFLFFLFSQFQIIPLQKNTVSIHVEEKPEHSSSYIVEQNIFNHQTPQDTPYLSQYNNTTAEEQKGKLGESPSPFFQKNHLDASSLSFPHQTFSSGHIDFLNHVEKKGDQNLLNTKEIRFFTFQLRVRHQIYWHWIRELETEMQDFYNTFPSSKSLLTTRIEAQLDSKGHLNSIVIRKKSGVEEMDLASVHAIQKAHPFPNPPEPLISKDGKIRLEYTFALSHNPAPLLRDPSL